jgi:hypothetical protein
VPGLPLERAVLISDRPEFERSRISTLLHTTLYRHLPLEFLTPAADTPASVLGKTAAATRWGCTHFIEPDAEHAIGIAASAPHLLVTWWSVALRRGWAVGATPTITPPDEARG